jgi:hypothetical protein
MGCAPIAWDQLMLRRSICNPNLSQFTVMP